MRLINPHTTDLSVSIPFKCRPVLLLGLSATTDYIQLFSSKLEAMLRAQRDFGGAVDVHSVHLNPNEPVESPLEEKACLRAWVEEKDPIHVAAYADTLSFKKPAARLFLEMYGEFVARLEDSKFDCEHGASLEMGKKTWKIFTKSKRDEVVSWVNEVSARRADRTTRIYIPAEKESGTAFLGAGLAAVMLSTRESRFELAAE